MKRFLALLAVTIATAVAAATAASAETGIPACADINGGSVTYIGADGFGDPTTNPPNTVTGGLTTVEPSCPGITYWMVVVQYNADGTTSYGFDVLRGNRTLSVGQFSVSNVTAPSACVYFVSSRGRTIYDTAPDQGCSDPGTAIILTPDSGSPGGSSPFQ